MVLVSKCAGPVLGLPRGYPPGEALNAPLAELRRCNCGGGQGGRARGQGWWAVLGAGRGGTRGGRRSGGHGQRYIGLSGRPGKNKINKRGKSPQPS